MRIQSSVDNHLQDLMRFWRAPTRLLPQPGEGYSMAGKSRGAALTIFALLFGLLAISNFSKPFSHDPGIGFVFMGVRLKGTANAIMGPLFGILPCDLRIRHLDDAPIRTAGRVHLYGVGNREYDSVRHEEPRRAAAFARLFDCGNRDWHWRPARDGDHFVSPSGRSHLMEL